MELFGWFNRLWKPGACGLEGNSYMLPIVDAGGGFTWPGFHVRRWVQDKIKRKRSCVAVKTYWSVDPVWIQQYVFVWRYLLAVSPRLKLNTLWHNYGPDAHSTWLAHARTLFKPEINQPWNNSFLFASVIAVFVAPCSTLSGAWLQKRLRGLHFPRKATNYVCRSSSISSECTIFGISRFDFATRSYRHSSFHEGRYVFIGLGPAKELHDLSQKIT